MNFQKIAQRIWTFFREWNQYENDLTLQLLISVLYTANFRLEGGPKPTIYQFVKMHITVTSLQKIWLIILISHQELVDILHIIHSTYVFFIIITV